MTYLELRRSCAGALLLLVAVLGETGCGHPTVVIHGADGPPMLQPAQKAIQSVPGIPFYAKRGVCKRETVWAEPRYTLQLSTKNGDQQIALHSLTFPRSLLYDKQFSNLASSLSQIVGKIDTTNTDSVCQAVNTAAKQWKAVAENIRLNSKALCDTVSNNDCTPLDLAEKNKDIVRMSNTASIVAEVDYDHVYYLNSQTPWIGTSQVDAKLNTDGTLSEASAQTTDQTWSTILGTVSSLAGDFTTFLGSVAEYGLPKLTRVLPPDIPACMPPPDWPLPGKNLVYVLNPSTETYIHNHTLECLYPGDLVAGKCPAKPDTSAGNNSGSEADSGFEKCTVAPNGITGGNVTISKSDGGGNDKDNSNTIQVSGQVSLPKTGTGKN